jgi:murein DD-endopeptidase MepM/ murein hydrolase activator NlpD
MRFFYAGKKKNRSDLFGLVLAILFLAIFVVSASDQLLTPGPEENLDAYTTESEDFRAMDFGENGLAEMKAFAEENGLAFPDVVTTAMILYDYHFPGHFSSDMTGENFRKKQTRILTRKPEAYEKCRAVYGSLLECLNGFPIPKNTGQDQSFVSYENSWRYERTFGGERTHEGTDLMAGEKERGYFPVVSVSDGVVESVGWLKLGGWRIGVRSDTGVYFYYAHLHSYAKEWQEGERVAAGDLLGFMGDTGYSETEGTTGNFPVHLHFGIYLKTDHFAELSVNPYYILRYLEPSAAGAAY